MAYAKSGKISTESPDVSAIDLDDGILMAARVGRHGRADWRRLQCPGRDPQRGDGYDDEQDNATGSPFESTQKSIAHLLPVGPVKSSQSDI